MERTHVLRNVDNFLPVMLRNNPEHIKHPTLNLHFFDRF